MKAYTYVKPGLASFVDVDKPVIRKPTDAIVRIVKPLFVEQTSILSKEMFLLAKVVLFLVTKGLGLLKKLEKEFRTSKKATRS